MIEAGAGVLTIGKSDALRFNESLLHYYDTADAAPLKRCLHGCIKTLELPAPEYRNARRRAAPHADYEMEI